MNSKWDKLLKEVQEVNGRVQEMGMRVIKLEEAESERQKRKLIKSQKNSASENDKQ